jgi:hypothetical protein
MTRNRELAVVFAIMSPPASEGLVEEFVLPLSHLCPEWFQSFLDGIWAPYQTPECLGEVSGASGGGKKLT